VRPVGSWRKRFAFVAGNDDLSAVALAKADVEGAGATICPTGKSLLFFGNDVKPKIESNRKYFAFSE
jgi:hypothetical protein